MKKILLLFVLIFIFGIQRSKASHYAGADLTYTCLGGNTYLITYTFYRDCSGINPPTSILITLVCSSNSNLNFTSNLPKILGTGQEITPSCSASPTQCLNGNNYGIQEYVYQSTVILSPCNSWEMHNTSGARNPTTTLSNGGN